MQTKDEIKEAMKSNLPFFFRVSASVEFSQFKEKYKDVSDYAYKIAEPFLNKETIRYQSILIYVSLICLSVYFFDFSTLKLFEHDVKVDRTFLVLLSLFMAIITIIFATKAILDYKTKQIARQRDDFSLLETRAMLNIGILKVQVDSYYWDEIFNVIGEAHKSYSDATSAALEKSSDFKHIDIRTTRLDLESLKKNPDMEPVINSREEFLRDVSKQLESDRLLFEQRADKILKETSEQKKLTNDRLFFRDDSYQRIKKNFSETLEKWFDARRELASEFLNIALAYDSPELTRGDVLAGLLNKSKRINKVMVVLEVVLPIMFAVLALMVIWIEEIFSG